MELRDEGSGAVGPRRIGFAATGRPVEFDVITTGPVQLKHGNGQTTVVACDEKDFDSRWDTLGVLTQIGVRAVGRPIVAPAEHRFSLPANAPSRPERPS
jgi:hypothetical protein